MAGRGAPVRDENNNICGMSGANFDVTAARLSQETLARREHELRQLADAMPQIVWTARADGSVEHFNRRWYQYTGLTPEQNALRKQRLEQAVKTIVPALSPPPATIPAPPATAPATTPSTQAKGD